MVNFIKASFKEIRYKMTWPTYQKLAHLTTLFTMGAAVWILALLGIDKVYQNLQEYVYHWIEEST